MKTEIKKSFQHGFVLNEQELTRIFDTICQQLKKIENLTDFITNIEVKFINGAIYETNSLKDVTDIENFGSKLVTRLTISISDKTDKPEYQIAIRFINPLYDNDTINSITYFVKGNDKDWVYITCSSIDERIMKIKIFAPITLFNAKLLLPILFIIIMFIILTNISSLANYSSTLNHENIDLLQKKWEAKEIVDPIEMILLMEKAKLAQQQNVPNIKMILIPMVLTTIIAFVSILPTKITQSFALMLPIYNFCWGDYIEAYKKKKSWFYFIFIVIVLSLIISIVAGFIVNNWKIY